MRPARLALAATLLASSAMPQPAAPATTPRNPVELGRIAWLRNLDQALEAAQSKRLPVLLLFQEVPG